jgi:ABC-type transporter Mla subunit MlaD
MSARANHFKLGVFVLAGLGLGLAMLLALGMGRTWQKPLLMETYLDQSVQGLEVGSRVKYRGVDVGKVHGIGFSRNHYEEGKPSGAQTRYVLIEVAILDPVYRSMGPEGFRAFIKEEVDRGLRFRLNAQGITGLSYLELDYVEIDRSPVLPVSWTPEHPYVPSAPGQLTKLLTSVEGVFRKLEEVDVGLVLTNLNRLLATTESEIRGARLASLGTQATNLLMEVRASNAALQGLLSDPRWRELPGAAVGAVEELRRQLEGLDMDGLVKRLEGTLATAEQFLAGKETDLAQVLLNLRAITENLRAVSEVAKSHPGSLLFGAPPRAVQEGGP